MNSSNTILTALTSSEVSELVQNGQMGKEDCAAPAEANIYNLNVKIYKICCPVSY